MKWEWGCTGGARRFPPPGSKSRRPSARHREEQWKWDCEGGRQVAFGRETRILQFRERVSRSNFSGFSARSILECVKWEWEWEGGRRIHGTRFFSVLHREIFSQLLNEKPHPKGVKWEWEWEDGNRNRSQLRVGCDFSRDRTEKF